MDDPIFFDGLAGLTRILATAPVMYFAIIFLVRASGKRSTSQMNNFDWVVTVAMGSIGASSIVNGSVTVAEAVLAIATLLFLQYVVTRTILVFPLAATVFKPRPRLLVHRGELLPESLWYERIATAEIEAAVRSSGLTEIAQAELVILETDATFSVIPKVKEGHVDTGLDGIAGVPPSAA